MPKTSRADDVDAFLAALDHPRKDEVEAVRATVLAVDGRIAEGVKWNAPSFHVDGRHFLTFKLRPRDVVQLVFHTGAKKRADPAPVTVDDPHGWLAWAAPDRCVADFASADDVERRREALTTVVRQWVAQL